MQLIALLVGVVLVPAAVIVFIAAGEGILRRLPHRARTRVRPFFWLVPVVLLVGAVLIYPTLATLWLSFRSSSGSSFIGLDNFFWTFGSDVLPTLANNVLWLVLLPLGIVVVATGMSVLIDRVRYEVVARTLLVLPTAVSLTAAGISWRLLYTWAPAGRTQLGAFNAILQALHVSPVAWISRPPTDAQWLNSVALVVVAVWAGLGVAVLVISAAIKAVPADTLEAARLDGAGEFLLFGRIVLPQIWPSVLTVITTQVIMALKVFDVVYVMTNGNSGTQVVANTMYTQLFDYPNQLGHASAIAVVLLVFALPVVWFNIRTIRKESAT